MEDRVTKEYPNIKKKKTLIIKQIPQISEYDQNTKLRIHVVESDMNYRKIIQFY